MDEQRRIKFISHNGPEQIKREIERTRENMGDTIDEIKERLSAQYMKEQIREAAIEKTRSVIETTAANIKNHPVWYAAGGAGAGGLVWLLARRTHHNGRHRSDSAESTGTSTGYVGGETGWNRRSAAAQLKTEDVKNRVPEKPRRDWLLLGAITFLAGAISGFMLPASTWEREWARIARDVFGETSRDR